MTEALVGRIVAHGVSAVGFVNEGQLFTVPAESAARVALLEAWASAGIELGNHTFGHRRLRDVPPDAFLRDVERGSLVSRRIAADHGLPYRWFRHPYLDTGPDLGVRRAVEHGLAGYRVAPVTVDPDDWAFALVYADGRGMEVVAAYLAHLDAVLRWAVDAAARLFGRPIPHVLLVHANELNAEHFDRVVGVVAGRGGRFVPLDEAVADPAYATPERFSRSDGVGWLERWAEAFGVPLPDRPVVAPRVMAAYRRLDAVAPLRLPGTPN